MWYHPELILTVCGLDMGVECIEIEMPLQDPPSHMTHLRDNNLKIGRALRLWMTPVNLQPENVGREGANDRRARDG